jgi:hypothetical protein
VIEVGLLLMKSVTLVPLSWGQGTFSMYTLPARDLTQKTPSSGIQNEKYVPDIPTNI